MWDDINRVPPKNESILDSIRKPAPAVTFWCSFCKHTSVADQNDDGTYTCPHCGK